MDWLDSESDLEKDSSNNFIFKRNSATSTDDSIYAKRQTGQDTNSITNSVQDLELNDKKKLTKKTSFNMENCDEIPHNIVLDEEGNYKTQDKQTHNVFIVSEDMLMYRGQRYSITDIAQLWKKDCRTWLWKSKKRHQTNKNTDEIRKRSKTTLN